MSAYKPLFEAADKFIDLANQLAAEDKTGNVGAALRYAAARYNAFEASRSTQDLRADKDKQLKAFGDDYVAMLDYNIEEHIGRM